MHYGEIGGVKLRAGVDPLDLFEDENEISAESQLDTYIEKLLIRSKEYIDFYTNNEFTDEDRSALVDDIAERIASRMLNITVRDQTNQMLEVNDFNAEFIRDEVMTDAIKSDLDMLPSANKKVQGKGEIDVGIVADEDDFNFYQ